ncbi:hypothetical protein [Sulfurimonas sp.]|uniref:hypothetical protein n=1 Tax=Sulfurimonas sp. TaxID=2022749 RepID=UPI0026386EF1|nr:hypothetical protein [Sulfurimonas sp.]MDD3855891.1 hypothetical protein [Sulfurimonas sp.]
MNENKSIEEIQALINENNERMSILREKIEQTKKDKAKKLQDVTDLIIEITDTKKIYYDNRRVLGNAILFELTDDEFDSIEAMMPIYEQKIKLLEEKFKNIDFKAIL